jgi:CubicO group peptidase (beta-lactamase class C family)
MIARRAFLAGAGRLAAIHSAAPFLGLAGETSDPLDAFILPYMKEMNAPGLTLALANRSGTVRTAAFGVADLDNKTPLTRDHLFQIGSITKSFVALTLLQLREEGKVEFEKPVLEYLPWLPIENEFRRSNGASSAVAHVRPAEQLSSFPERPCPPSRAGFQAGGAL